MHYLVLWFWSAFSSIFLKQSRAVGTALSLALLLASLGVLVSRLRHEEIERILRNTLRKVTSWVR